MTTIDANAPPFGPDFDPFSHGFEHYGADTFETFIGPLYARAIDGGHEFLSRIESHHSNMLGAAHGGFMLALADVFLSGTCWLHLGSEQDFVTVNLSHEFLGGAPTGSWVLGRGRLRKEGKSLMFAECEFFVGGENIGIARCVMKKIRIAR